MVELGGQFGNNVGLDVEGLRVRIPGGLQVLLLHSGVLQEVGDFPDLEGLDVEDLLLVLLQPFEDFRAVQSLGGFGRAQPHDDLLEDIVQMGQLVQMLDPLVQLFVAEAVVAAGLGGGVDVLGVGEDCAVEEGEADGEGFGQFEVTLGVSVPEVQFLDLLRR